MNEVVEFTPAIVALHGTTKSERQLSAINHMTKAALTATALSGGKLGKAAAAQLGEVTALDFAHECAWPGNNYKGLASYIAGQLGEDIVIGSRATYLSLVDQMDQRIMKVKAAKSGGYRTDANGIQVPNATLSKLMGIRALVVDVHAAEKVISTARRAEHQAKRDAEQRQIANESAQ